MDLKKLAAEAIGTFWLTFGGCGSAVIAAAFPHVGIGLVGVSLAFGLTLLTMAYAIGHISGCHINPAVTIGLAAGGRFPVSEIGPYIVAQVVGAIVGAALLYIIASGAPDFTVSDGFGAFAWSLRSTVMLHNGSSHDHDVLVYHHGLNARAGTGGLCAYRDRAGADTNSLGQHSRDQYIRQPCSKHRTRALCGRLGY
jgi:hypothetical protein